MYHLIVHGYRPCSSLYQTTLKTLADNKRKHIKNINLVLSRKKIVWEKEKMMVTKLKALAYDKKNATDKYKFVFKRLATSH